MDNLFSTHPSTENRIAALQGLARELGQGSYGSRRGSAPQRPDSPGGSTGGSRGPWG